MLLTNAVYGRLIFLACCSQYQEGEEVTVWVNKIGPFHNPQETYPFASLGLCQNEAKDMRKHSGGFGTMLQGDDLKDSGIVIRFRGETPRLRATSPPALSDPSPSFLENIAKTPMCSMKLDSNNIAKLTDAVEQHYWYQMFIGKTLIHQKAFRDLEERAPDISS
jgi:transmembrane 9 superfamily member 3